MERSRSTKTRPRYNTLASFAIGSCTTFFRRAANQAACAASSSTVCIQTEFSADTREAHKSVPSACQESVVDSHRSHFYIWSRVIATSTLLTHASEPGSRYISHFCRSQYLQPAAGVTTGRADTTHARKAAVHSSNWFTACCHFWRSMHCSWWGTSMVWL
jgi:hypothetical protein